MLKLYIYPPNPYDSLRRSFTVETRRNRPEHRYLYDIVDNSVLQKSTKFRFELDPKRCSTNASFPATNTSVSLTKHTARQPQNIDSKNVRVNLTGTIYRTNNSLLPPPLVEAQTWDSSKLRSHPVKSEELLATIDEGAHKSRTKRRRKSVVAQHRIGRNPRSPSPPPEWRRRIDVIIINRARVHARPWLRERNIRRYYRYYYYY